MEDYSSVPKDHNEVHSGELSCRWPPKARLPFINFPSAECKHLSSFVPSSTQECTASACFSAFRMCSNLNADLGIFVLMESCGCQGGLIRRVRCIVMRGTFFWVFWNIYQNLLEGNLSIQRKRKNEQKKISPANLIEVKYGGGGGNGGEVTL